MKVSAAIALAFLSLANAADPKFDWTDKSPHKSEFITVSGVRLHYLDWGGAGETMLLLHGLGDTAHIYDLLAPKFTNEFRVLGLTRRGHGQSDKPETGYDTATLVEDIRQFLDALTIRRVILVGHSIAGDELTRFAGAHPDRVAKLVYLDGAHDRAGLPEIMKDHPPELSPSKTDMESLASFRRWLRRMSFWSDAWEANLREMMVCSADGKILREAKPAKVSRLLMQGTVDSHPDYTKIRSPALNIAVVGFSAKISDVVQTLPEPARAKAEGALSKTKEFQQQQIERFRKELPSAQVVVLTNADHHCFIHREDDVVREMRVFLAPSESPERSSPTGRFVAANGVQLHYLDWGGNGETMLFLHGIGDTAHTFNGFAPNFTNQFRVIALTRRGHGESEVPDSGYDTATRVEDIRHFLDALNISRVVLVGFSASGGEMTMFAGKHPERTIKAVYLDALFDADGQPALYRRAPPELRRAQEAALGSKRSRALELMAAGEAHTDYAKIKAPVLAIAVVGFPTNTFDTLKDLPEPRRKLAEDALREVLVVKRRETERFRKELPNARLVMLTNANHACFIDREDDVLREMRAFLAPANRQSR